MTPPQRADAPMACCFDDAATLESSAPAPTTTSNGHAVDVFADLALDGSAPSPRHAGEIPAHPLDPRAAPPLFTLYASLLI
ncbi:MAG: hypothetical protein AAGC60_20945 [Acidobacteriota bacterium]